MDYWAFDLRKIAPKTLREEKNLCKSRNGQENVFPDCDFKNCPVSHRDKTDLLKFSLKKQPQIQNKQYSNSNILNSSVMPGLQMKLKTHILQTM